MSERGEAVGVIGVGWVGLVTAACFAELGYQVIARDILPEKVEALSRGEVKIHEPGLTEMIQRNLERITFTTDMGELLGGARLLFTCRPFSCTVALQHLYILRIALSNIYNSLTSLTKSKSISLSSLNQLTERLPPKWVWRRQ